MPADSDIELYSHNMNVLESLYQHYSKMGNVVIAGDMNASCIDTYCVNQEKSSILRTFTDRCQLCIPMIDFDIDGETYSFTQKQTMLDYIFVSKTYLPYLCAYSVFKEGTISMTSDHLPICVDISVHCKRHALLISSTSLPAWYKASSDDISNYQSTLSRKLSALDSFNLSNISDLDMFCDEFTRILRESANETIPCAGYCPFKRPEWTKEVKELHELERSKRRVWMLEGRPRGMIFDSFREYKRAKRSFRNALTLAHDQYIQETFRDIDEAAECDVRLFWKLIHKQKPRSSRHYPEIVDKHGNSYNDPSGVAECFADHFQDIYTPCDETFDQDFKDVVDREFDQIKYRCLNDDHFHGGDITIDDVLKALRNLKLRKAPGDDKITNEHLKYGGKTAIDYLLALFRAIIKIGKIPTSWKKGIIVPIQKGGSNDKRSCNNYRPVALLSSMLKTFEYILKERMERATDDSFPHAQQQGFRAQLGCLTASFIAQETILHNVENGSNVYTCFLDTRKAFDTVWRNGLLVKLYKLGVSGRLWTLICDSHTDTSSAVVVNFTQSRWFPVLQGVR
ncbi:hypothetical protein FSP39_007309 [Pinctada imbricata]|uniref:Reverse transcriptase domain-containing protein n=1 Tax=Pinctada imbricata TaxID=66713 RepID=A0AA88XF07_PINIB|nr:hypothetical protein FSP39_007309 [Pinctada imbricata]